MFIMYTKKNNTKNRLFDKQMNRRFLFINIYMVFLYVKFFFYFFKYIIVCKYNKSWMWFLQNPKQLIYIFLLYDQSLSAFYKFRYFFCAYKYVPSWKSVCICGVFYIFLLLYQMPFKPSYQRKSFLWMNFFSA